jgi:hypothetical protein
MRRITRREAGAALLHTAQLTPTPLPCFIPATKHFRLHRQLEPTQSLLFLQDIRISTEYLSSHHFPFPLFQDIYVSTEYLSPGDRVLIIDDFLAGGRTADAMIRVCKMANANVVGGGFLIEKVRSRRRPEPRTTHTRAPSARISQWFRPGPQGTHRRRLEISTPDSSSARQ